MTHEREIYWLYGSTPYGSCRVQEAVKEDVELGRKLALREWIGKIIPKFAKSFDDFIENWKGISLNGTCTVPLESIHPEINALIKEKQKNDVDAAASEEATNTPANDVPAQQA
ncbi:hypothetical protein HK097_002618 [Rhizophlyctis rosea]|uniref:Uncharacterized protein n=1 Tax=Rhizophlyctis rosea TaxID=64517 RepID=A0AAD5S5S3_9FUNG|nr:hypothetical protein HK097_002618 [Rhizophlyctis rosea]